MTTDRAERPPAERTATPTDRGAAGAVGGDAAEGGPGERDPRERDAAARDQAERDAAGRGAAERDAAERDADARALASTLRLRILRLCLDEPLTNREIAARLDRNPATVLHHVRTLVDRGFLRAEAARRGTRGSREVPYRATRRSWELRDMTGVARTLIDTFLEEVALVDPETVTVTRLGLRLDAAGRAELADRLQQVADEFATRAPTPGGTAYSLFYAVHEDVTRDAAQAGADDAATGTDASDPAAQR